MRDPDAALEFDESLVIRRLRTPLLQGHFLQSALARRWVDSGRLIRFHLQDESTVVAERLPFVSHPTEWCDAQLFDAASLTLDLQAEAVEAGFDMKDASAWNVIFRNTQPVFCDLTSFVPITHAAWWPAGQFARHFILPLAVSRLKGLRAHTAFQVSREGLRPQDARHLLGVPRFLTRFWPVMAEAKGAGRRHGLVVNSGADSLPPSALASRRRGLHASLRWILEGAKPRREPDSHWSRYREHRAHYGEADLEVKRQAVGRWLARISPGAVLDLGCNTGEFSLQAAAVNARVVAIDADHDAIQSLYASLPSGSTVHPLVASLDDMSGGRGWEGREHPGLLDRLACRFDMVLMLALLHHLIVASSIPILEVARFARRCTRQWAIVEWIGADDSQLALLCAQRQRNVFEFSMTSQRAAFSEAGLQVVEELPLAGGARRLALLRVAA